MQGPHQSFPWLFWLQIGTQSLSTHPGAWAPGFEGIWVLVWAHSPFLLMYFQKFSVLLGVKLYKNSIYMLLGDPSVVPTRPWLILSRVGAVVASVAISALSAALGKL